MSLFDRDEVAPPEPCSRCGSLVPRTSLFCPQCGQSRVNPLEKPKLDVPEPDAEPAEVEPPQEEEADEEERRSTLSRTTDWIIRNITRVGQHPGDEAVSQSNDPDSVEVSEEDAPAARKTSSWPERLQQSSRAQARFELVREDGSRHTLGEAPGALGSAQHAPDDEPGQWIWVLAEDSSVDPLHLRFGVDDGLFWIEDNNSIIGTVIEEPGRAALQCIPHERYFLVRGSTLTVGTVSLTLQ